MTIHGQIKDGVVVLDDASTLSEGTHVLVCAYNFECDGLVEDDEGATLLERLSPVIGVAEGLPSDASVNIDHYLYGAEKV